MQEPGVFQFLQITQNLNKIQKILTTLLFILVSRKLVQNFNKNYLTLCLTLWQLEFVKIFNFSDKIPKITWSLENNRALSKFLYEILHYLISIIKVQGNRSINSNFTLTTRASLPSLGSQIRQRKASFQGCKREKLFETMLTTTRKLSLLQFSIKKTRSE